MATDVRPTGDCRKQGEDLCKRIDELLKELGVELEEVTAPAPERPAA